MPALFASMALFCSCFSFTSSSFFSNECSRVTIPLHFLHHLSAAFQTCVLRSLTVTEGLEMTDVVIIVVVVFGVGVALLLPTRLLTKLLLFSFSFSCSSFLCVGFSLQFHYLVIINYLA